MCPNLSHGTDGGEYSPDEPLDFGDILREFRERPELALLPRFSAALHSLTGKVSENLNEQDPWHHPHAHAQLLKHVEAELARLPSECDVLGGISVAEGWVKQCGGAYYCGICLRAGNGEWVVPSTFLRQSPKGASEIDLTIEVTGSPTLVVFKCEPGSKAEPAFLLLDETSAKRLMDNATRQNKRNQVHAHEAAPEELDARFTSYIAEIVRAELHQVLQEQFLGHRCPPVLIQSMEISEIGAGAFEVLVNARTRLPRTIVPDCASDCFHLIIGLGSTGFKFEVINTRIPDQMLQAIIASS